MGILNISKRKNFIRVREHVAMYLQERTNNLTVVEFV